MLTAIAIGIGLASSAFSAYQSREQAKQARANAEYDALLAEQQAEEKRKARAIEALNERRQARRRIEGMRATYAKSGVEMQGSPEQVIGEQAKADEFNILSRNRFSNIGAQNLETQASLTRQRGESAAAAYRSQSTATLLQGATSAVGTYASYRYRIGSKTPQVTAPSSGYKMSPSQFY